MKNEMNEISPDIVRSLIPPRDDKGHKGSFGTALIIAGSRYMTGAGVLSTEAALRSGTGIVRYMSEDEALLPVKIYCPCAVTSPIGEDPIASLKDNLKKATATLIGPGVREDDEKILMILTHVLGRAKTLAADASALNIISRYKDHYLSLIKERQGNGLAPVVLTPHIGEFRRLSGGEYSPDEEGCVRFAKDLGCVLVLKDSDTLIAGPDGRTFINRGCNSGMAKGGSGDVLAGLLTGLLAQGMAPLDAAVAATYIHSQSGVLAAEQKGVRAMLPSDLTGFFPEVMKGLTCA